MVIRCKQFWEFSETQYFSVDDSVISPEKRVNPFIKANPFKKGDAIVGFNGKKVHNSATFMRKILFSKVGSSHRIKVKRGSKYLNFKVKTKKRYGGGYLSDTFLEQKGQVGLIELWSTQLNQNSYNSKHMKGIMSLQGTEWKKQFLK